MLYTSVLLISHILYKSYVIQASVYPKLSKSLNTILWSFLFNAESCVVRTFSNTHLVKMVMSPKVVRYSIIVGVVELVVAAFCVLVGIIALGMGSNRIIATSGLWALVVSS